MKTQSSTSKEGDGKKEKDVVIDIDINLSNFLNAAILIILLIATGLLLKQALFEEPPTVPPPGQGATIQETEMAVRSGDVVSVDYIGKFDNGSVFDTTQKEIADRAGLTSPQTSYAPISLRVGAGRNGFARPV